MKYNILLINPAINPASQNKVVNAVIINLLPTSLGALAGYLQSSSIDSFRIVDEQIDFLDDSSLKRVIEALAKPKIVGISVLTINSKRAYELADKIKAIDKDVFIVLGGIHPTVLPDEALNRNGVDIVVRGEGERTLLELIRHICNGTDYTGVLGISFKKRGSVTHNPDMPLILNLDDMPPFPYELFEKDMAKYGSFAAVFTSRGCPYNCTFCSSRNVSGMRYRHHSVKRILSDIALLVDKYGQKTIWFIDDNIAANKRAFIELLDAIIENGLHRKVQFHGSLRGDNATDEVLDKVKEANFRMLSFGLETTSESLMKVINKGESVKAVIDAINRTDERGIAVAATLIFGLPTEKRKDRWGAIKLVRQLPLSSVRFNTLTPYPGTPVFEHLKGEGGLFIKKDWENFAVQYMWESDDIPYVPEGNDRYELLFDTMFANLSFYLSFNGIRRMIKSSFAGGNVVNLAHRWYLSPKEMWKLFRLFLYLAGSFLYITFKMSFRKLSGMSISKRLEKDSAVILTNELSFLKGRAGAGRRAISYIMIDEDKRTESIRNYMSALPEAQEVVASDYMEESEFAKKYSLFMSGLNKNNASLTWWAMNFTNKNPLLTMLCKNAFDFLLIKKLAKSAAPGVDLLVATSDPRLAHFVRNRIRKNGSRISLKISARPNFKLLTLYLPSLFAIYHFARFVGRVILSRLAFNPSRVPDRLDYVIVTQFMESSFLAGGPVPDLYF